jgi:NAD(P)-dependent dehydrogenase (short-subunit alcohol dehydrogenase family)
MAFLTGETMKIVLITGLEKEFDRKLACAFVRENYKVYAISEKQIDGVFLLPADLKEAAAALQKEEKFIDIYIDASDERSPQDNFNARSGLNEQVIKELYDANVTRPMAMLEAVFPLLEAGENKRICFLTSAEASINETQGTDGYGYKMAKAALHNFLQITRNVLAPKGYSIRAFDPCLTVISAEMSAEAAFNYFTRRRGIERGDAQRDDEGNLVLRDAFGRQHTW